MKASAEDSLVLLHSFTSGCTYMAEIPQWIPATINNNNNNNLQYFVVTVTKRFWSVFSTFLCVRCEPCFITLL